MKYFILLFSLFFATDAEAKSYLCKPIHGCHLPEGICDMSLDYQTPAIVQLSDKEVSLSINGIVELIQVLNKAAGLGKTSYFGILGSDHFLITLFEDGSMYVFGVETRYGNTAGVAELACEVQ